MYNEKIWGWAKIPEGTEGIRVQHNQNMKQVLQFYSNISLLSANSYELTCSMYTQPTLVQTVKQCCQLSIGLIGNKSRLCHE